jgi:hypothetical protein
MALRRENAFSIGLRAVGRQEAKGGACCLNAFADCRTLVAREVVHNDDVVRLQLRHQHLGYIGLEPVAVDGAIKHHRCDHAAHAQTGDQRRGLAVTVREAHPQALALGTAAMAAGHVGGRPGLVDKHEALRLQIELAVEPVSALSQDVGTVLLDRVPGLFLRVIP